MLVKGYKKITILVVLIFSIFANGFHISTVHAADPGTAQKLQTAIDSASTYVNNNQVDNNPYADWNAVALKKAGKSISSYYLNHDQQLVQSNQISSITDYERTTLGVLAAGGNPGNFNGTNLLEHIYNGDANAQINGVLFALIALDSANFDIPSNATWTREKLKNSLVSTQLQDGGWPGYYGTSDIDTTAMVLTALAPYESDAVMKKAIDSGLSFIQTNKSKIDNSSTASQVIIALSALGIDANSEPYVNNGTGLVDLLFTFQISDGGFTWKYVKDGGWSDSSDPFSTDQAFRGLVAYQLYLNKKGSLYNLPIYTNNSPVSTSNTQVETSGIQPTQQPTQHPTQAVQPNNSGGDQVQTVSTNNKTSTTNSTNNNGNTVQSGQLLPNTATNTENIIFTGFLLLITGVTLYYFNRRREA